MIMRIIVDIPEDIYNHIIVDSEYFTPSLVNAFRNGTPIPDNTTNGNVIKALYPNERIGHCEDCTDLGDIATFDDDWWNAPYQKGGKEEK